MTPCLSLPTLPGLPKSAPLLSPGVSPLLKRQNSLRPLNLGQLNIEDTEFSLVREECRVATAVLSRVRDYLYVGGVESASLDSSTFRKHNIVTVVNLAAGAIENNVHVDGVKIVRVYSRDSEAEDATALIPIVALEVADAKRRKGAVLIHCHRGISRSCAMATAVLMLEEKADAGWALSELRIARPVASPNPGFVRALQTLQAAIHGEPNRRIAVLARLKGDPGDGVEVLVETNKAQMASNRRAWAALVVERGNSDGVLAVRGPLVHERRWRKTLRLARWIVERNGLVGGNSHARGNTLDVAMMRDDSTLLHD